MGKTVAGYKVHDTVLGSGGYGEVRTGLSPAGVKVAVKVMNKDLIFSKEGAPTKQLAREIRAMKALEHPNIVKLHDALDTQKNVYLVLELVDGGDLCTYLYNHRFCLKEATYRHFFKQLVVGMRYMHSQRLAHRDIKPENLLLTQQGVLKIADFGLSNAQKATADRLFTVCGTQYYMPPEMFSRNREGYDGFLADVWASGVVLYVMACGRLPFSGNSTAAVITSILNGRYIIPKTVPKGPAALIQDMVCRDVARRPSMQIVAKYPWLQEELEDHMSLTSPSPSPSSSSTIPSD